MENSIQILKTFSSKKGNTVIVRTPGIEDVEALTDYMNELSSEDTFISFGGEQLTLEEEQEYVESLLKDIEKREALKILAFIEKELVGNADITKQKRRSSHVATLAISVKKGYREEGIGVELMRILIEKAQEMHIKMLELGCFANNPRALYLYEKLGFIRVGRIPRKYFYKNEYIDEIVMVKELSM